MVPEIDPRAFERLRMTQENLDAWQGEITEIVTRDRALMNVLN